MPAEGQVAQILAFAGEEVEGIKARFTTMKEQIFKVGLPSIVQADDLAVEYGSVSPAFLQ